MRGLDSPNAELPWAAWTIKRKTITAIGSSNQTPFSALIIFPFISFSVRSRFQWIETADHARLECLVRPSVGTFLFGIPFVGMPAFFVYNLIFNNRFAEIIAEARAAGDNLWWLGLQEFIVMAIVLGILSFFLAAGLWCMFGRKGTIFDKTSGQAASWWRVLFVKREKQCLLADFSRIEVYRAGGNWRTGPQYSVKLTGSDQQRLYVSIFGSMAEANEFATELGQFLKMEVGLGERPNR